MSGFNGWLKSQIKWLTMTINRYLSWFFLIISCHSKKEWIYNLKNNLWVVYLLGRIVLYKEGTLESQIGADLSRVVRMWRSLIDHRLKPLKLTQTHWITLHNISQLPPEQSQIQLAKAIGIEQPSLVRTLDQLEEKNWFLVTLVRMTVVQKE